MATLVNSGIEKTTVLIGVDNTFTVSNNYIDKLWFKELGDDDSASTFINYGDTASFRSDMEFWYRNAYETKSFTNFLIRT